MLRILVTTDGSEFALRSARRGLAMLAPGSEVTVLTVVSVPVVPTAAPAGAMGAGFDPALSSDVIDAATDTATHEVDAAIAELGIDAEPRVELGDPGPTICEIAGSEGFDVIVIGSHGSGVLKRMLVGSVSHHVLHHAPCPVLVVREAETVVGDDS